MVQLPALTFQQPKEDVFSGILTGQKIRQNQQVLDQNALAQALTRQEMAQGQLAQQQQNALSGARQAFLGGDNAALSQVAAIDPKEAKQLQDFAATASKQDRDRVLAQNQAIFKELSVIEALPTQEQGPALFEAAKRLGQQGIDVTGSLKGVTPQNIGQKVAEFRIRSQAVDDILKQAKPQSNLGKEAEDRRRGFITPADEKGPKKTALDQKIEEIMASQGVDRQTASGIATGTLKPITNPVTGNTELVDLTTGEARPINAAAVNAPDVAGDVSGPGLFERTRGVPGIFGKVVEIAQGTIGQAIDLGDVASEITANRTAYKAAQQQMVRALSNNPRFPVGEMEAIKKEIDIKPSVLDNPQSLQTRMIEIDRTLRNRIKQNLRIAYDPQMPSDFRADMARAAVEMENFLSIMGVPQDISDPQSNDAELAKNQILQEVLGGQ